jgi:hypothetical protein
MIGSGKSEKDRMGKFARTSFLIGSAMLFVAALTGCMSAEEQRRADVYTDGGTCSDFGAGYGSRSHTRCMLQQQRRRDHEQVLNMERARISAETARNNLEMLEIIRKRRRQ